MTLDLLSIVYCSQCNIKKDDINWFLLSLSHCISVTFQQRTIPLAAVSSTRMKRYTKQASTMQIGEESNWSQENRGMQQIAHSWEKKKPSELWGWLFCRITAVGPGIYDSNWLVNGSESQSVKLGLLGKEETEMHV